MKQAKTITEEAFDLGLAECLCALANGEQALYTDGDLKRAIHHARRARHWLDLIEQLAPITFVRYESAVPSAPAQLDADLRALLPHRLAAVPRAVHPRKLKSV